MRELMHPITMGYGSPARLGGLGAVTPLASKPGLLPLESSSPSSTQQPQQQAQQITRRLVLTDLPVDVLAVIVGFLTQGRMTHVRWFSLWTRTYGISDSCLA